jgi:hypothetical protein
MTKLCSSGYRQHEYADPSGRAEALDQRDGAAVAFVALEPGIEVNLKGVMMFNLIVGAPMWLKQRMARMPAAMGFMFLLAACGSGGNQPESAPTPPTAAAATAEPILAAAKDELLADGIYTLANGCSGQMLDVQYASAGDGAHIVQYPGNGGANQRWRLSQQGDGSVTLVAMHSGKALDMDTSGTHRIDNTPRAIQWNLHGGTNQRWRLTQTVPGQYRISSLAAPDRVLDVQGASPAPEAPVWLWEINGHCAQSWRFTRVDAPGPGNEQAAVVLPVEVMGPAGTVESVTVDVPGGGRTARLALTANNISYDGKVSVQLNNGAWVELTNQTAAVSEPAKTYGGIGGAHGTLKLTVPIAGGVEGKNTLRFRFNRTDGISSGFRVIDFDLLDAGGAGLVPRSALTQENPAAWTAPLNTPQDIAEGERLWRTAQLKESPINGARTLRAQCMDCHAQSGYDLHRFNYSNKSITARAQFHGLSETQGKQIASYIRSLTAKFGPPGEKCRPWNPPYQPGPGLDGKPIADWACGAGVEMALEKDSDSIPYIFGNGISKAPIEAHKQINLREIPVSLQLPDWKHWLPRVHPKDAWGDYFVNHNLNKRYAGEGGGDAQPTWVLRKQLQEKGKSYILNQSEELWNNLYYWQVEWHERFNPPGGKDANQSFEMQNKVYGTLQWFLVKNWEIAQEFGMESACPEAYRARGALKVEPRSWCGRVRTIFDVSPNLAGIPGGNNIFGGSAAQHQISNAWYYLQILLNPGSGAHSVHLPTDWSYAYGLLNDMKKITGRGEPVRNLLYIVKGTQEMANGIGPNDEVKGWTWRDASPLDLWRNGKNEGFWNGVPDQTRNAIVNAYLETWLDYNERFPEQQWARVDQPGGSGTCGWSERRLCWRDYVPGTLRGPSPTDQNFPSWTYGTIPEMRAQGIDGALVNRYARLMHKLYPNGGYDKLVK